jgi:hypothetical protein
MKQNDRQPDGRKSLRKGLILFAAAAAFLLLLCAAAVYYVDPFFHYHAPLKNFPYVVDNQLTQNPGMAEHMDYDSVILGSSMTFNFNTNDFRDTFGLHTIKLSYAGAYPHDVSNIAKIVFDGKHDVKRVFLAIDPFSCTAETGDTKYPVPSYLYDSNPLNDVSYLLSGDVLLEYVLRPLFDPDPTDLSTVYQTWWTPDYYCEEWVMHEYRPAEKTAEKTPADAYIDRAMANLEENICPYIEQHPETQFTIFFPPYSILYWNDVQNENHLDATLEEYRAIADRLLSYDNVDLYCFPTEKDLVTDLSNYADIEHYSPEVNHWMVQCFADGTDRIGSSAEMDAAVKKMKDIAVSYDYDALFARYPLTLNSE